MLASGPAASQTFNQFIGFGDSTIDSGSYRSLSSPGAAAQCSSGCGPAPLPMGGGKPTSSPGLVSSEALAAAFGLSAIPSDQGGTNYATSGAKNVTINNAHDRRLHGRNSDGDADRQLPGGERRPRQP